MGLAPPSRTEREEPACINDVVFTPTGEGGTTSLLLVKQREPIQYWQLVFGPRDCGCMAPGMPSSPVPSRRNRFAPTGGTMLYLSYFTPNDSRITLVWPAP